MEDPEREVAVRFRRAWAARVRSLVDEELIEEHRRVPRGPHSDPLARVLRYFRSAPIASKEIVIEVEPWSEYRIGLLTGIPGKPARPLAERYGTYDVALHAIFLRRIDQLRGEADAAG